MVRTRIAPSPTGNDIHIGNLYTAYINWAFARKNKGKFIIRIEDTDRERYVEGAEETILSTLEKYGIDYDEGPKKGGQYAPYRQSERLDIYQKYAAELIQKKQAYYCNCSKERLDEVRKKMIAEKKIPKYDKFCLNRQAEVKEAIDRGEKYVIRLNVPENEEVVFQDVIRGEVKINTANLDDQVLIKSDGFPTYHLAVVIDDHLMEISHIIRAEEWISSTPKHILLYKAFGWDLPIFAHLPILRNPDRSKLSKRKNPVWASWYLEQGYLPEAILNYLALMGWSHPEQKDIFSKEEFMQVFSLDRISPVGPAFDPVKLEWMNGQYIMKLSNEELKKKLIEFYNHEFSEEIVGKTVPLVKERIKKLSEYLPLCEFFFKAPEKYDIEVHNHKELLKKIAQRLSIIEDWKAETIGTQLVELAKELGVKNSEFFMILRVAITGKKITPPLNESLEILGKEQSVIRLTNIR